MKKKYLVLFILIFLNLSLLANSRSLPSEFGIKEVPKVDLQIAKNGLVKVEENLVLNQTTARVTIPKSSRELSLLGSQGNELGYELNQYSQGQTLNIYLKSPQERSVTLSYHTSALTEKRDSQWTFKFSSLSTSRVTILKIKFPPGTNITSLRSNETFYIYPPHLSSPLFIYPQSSQISLEVDYKLSSEESTPSFLPLVILLLPILLALIYFYIKKRKSIKSKEPEEEGMRINPSVLKMLDKTEKEIIKLLAQSEEEITQAYIYKTLGIPKSSLSDIIRRLEQRDLIKKKKEGRVNWINLREWVFR